MDSNFCVELEWITVAANVKFLDWFFLGSSQQCQLTFEMRKKIIENFQNLHTYCTLVGMSTRDPLWFILSEEKSVEKKYNSIRPHVPTANFRHTT